MKFDNKFEILFTFSLHNLTASSRLFQKKKCLCLANSILQAKRFWTRKEIWVKSGSVDMSSLITSNNLRARGSKAFAQESTSSSSTQRTSTTSYSTWMMTTSKKWIILLNLHSISCKKHEKIPTFWSTVRQESQDAVLFWWHT